jgi:hypothetical protein
LSPRPVKWFKRNREDQDIGSARKLTKTSRTGKPPDHARASLPVVILQHFKLFLRHRSDALLRPMERLKA